MHHYILITQQVQIQHFGKLMLNRVTWLLSLTEFYRLPIFSTILFLNKEPKDKFSFEYEKMTEFQEYMLEEIQVLREDAKTKNGLGHMYLHVGKLNVSTEKEGKELSFMILIS